MIIRFLLCAVVATLTIGVVHCFVTDVSKFIKFYEENLRGNLFAGFLTVGGFLLSLKTFILIKLKENVYDRPQYKKRYEDMKKLDASLQVYSPLRNLSDFLFWSVLATIGAAIAQLSIGLIGIQWFVYAAIWISVFALCILIASLLLIKTSLNDWFDFINDDSNQDDDA